MLNALTRISAIANSNGNQTFYTGKYSNLIIHKVMSDLNVIDGPIYPNLFVN